MKVIFKKNDKSEISVTLIDGGQEREFSYVDLVKHLIQANKLDEPEIKGDFTDKEIESINTMVKTINDDLAEEQSADNQTVE